MEKPINSFHGGQRRRDVDNNPTTNNNNDDDDEILHHPSTSTHQTSDSNDDTPRVVEFSSTEMADFHAEHEYSLFAKVLGKRVGHQRLCHHLGRLWSPEGTLEIVPLENDFFLLKFSDSSDYNKAVEGVPWLIDNHYITLHPWVPNFKPSEAIITHAAVWIRLPELPVEYYVQVALSRIAEAVGKLVKIDPVTERKLKGKFARLCVEVDLSRPLPPQVKLGSGLWQTIEYEGLHVLCYQCGRVGHLQQDCSYTHHHPNPQAISVLSTPHEAPTTSHDPSAINASSYGPWIQVPPRRGQQQRTRPLYHNVAIETGQAGQGSRFQVLGLENPNPDLIDEPNTPTQKSATVPVSMASPSRVKMNAGPGIRMEQTQRLPPGEGTSSAVPNILKSTQTEDVPLVSTQMAKPEEDSNRYFGTPFQPKVFPEFYSITPSYLSLDSTQQRQEHQSNPPSPSSVPIPQQVVTPSPSAPLVTTSTFTDSGIPNQSHKTSTFPHQKPFLPSSVFANSRSHSTSPMSIEFYSQGIQRSTQEREINIAPAELIERSTEGCPNIFTIESKISNIDIGVNIFPLPTGNGNQHQISFIPTVIDHTEYPSPRPGPKKLLSWNCRGAGDPKVIRAVKDLCKRHKPSIVLLFETRIAGIDAAQVIKDLGFSHSYYVDPVGFAGGVWLLWHKEVHIDVTSTGSHQIHGSVQFLHQAYDTDLHEWDLLYGIDSDQDSLS